MEIFWLSTRGETTALSDGHVWFSPIIPCDGKELLKCQDVYIQVFHDLGMESPITPFAHPRSWMYRAFCFMLGFSNSRTNQEHNLKLRQAYRKIAKVAAENGWGDYRDQPSKMMSWVHIPLITMLSCALMSNLKIALTQMES